MNEKIAARVRALREHRGLSIRALAAQCGLAFGALAALERADQDWRPHHLEAVAAALGVPPRDLLPGVDEHVGEPRRENPPPLTAGQLELLQAVARADAPTALEALARLLRALA